MEFEEPMVPHKVSEDMRESGMATPVTKPYFGSLAMKGDR